MGIIDILLTAVGLSMDASAVGMTNGMNEPKMPLRKIFLVAGFYGVFQGLMPLIGYLCASLFAQFVASVAPYVALVLLGFIGGKMIYEACKKEDACALKPLSLGTLTVQAIATSIDALTVGVSFAFLQVDILTAASLIGSVAFVLSAVGVRLGAVIGSRRRPAAVLTGGVILILMGTKILLEHLGIL